MPARLNVVIVQSPRMSSLQNEVTEQVMIELLGRPGIDLLIVQAINTDSESTDQMALASLESDIAVVDWQAEETMVARFAELGVAGYSASHPLNPQPPSATSMSGRRLYCFDLRLGFKAQQVVAAIRSLLAAKQVQTVGIGNLVLPRTTGLPVTISSAKATSTLPPAKPASQSQLPSAAKQNKPHHHAQDVTLDGDEDQRLDQLVDGLNNADW